MEKLFLFVERRTVDILTRRRAKRLAAKSKPRTLTGEILGWLDALLFAIVAVILINQYLFQLFVIPSPSMVHTLEIGDRVFVGKNSYGTEIYSTGPKLFAKNRLVHRDDIITFYNPEYENKGPFFNVLSQFLYSGTFTLVNIDKNPDGTPAERLLVKRAVGYPDEVVRFKDGNVMIRKAGSLGFVPESSMRDELGWIDAPIRSVDSDLYDGIRSWGALWGYQDRGFSADSAPADYMKAYSRVSNLSYPKDMYEFEKSRAETARALDPFDFDQRSEAAAYRSGIRVNEGQVLPLGDNRDNSRDGRYFGPVYQKNVNGRVLFRFWPLKRVSYLGNK